MTGRRLFRLRPWTRRQLDAEMREELDAHIALSTEFLVARGVPRDVAEVQARERFGDFDAASRALCRSATLREKRMQRREWFDMIRQDVTFAIRQARRELGVTAVIVATLGFGIGANAVMFGIVDRLLLSPPSNTPHAERVVRPWFVRTTKLGEASSYYTNYPGYRDLTALTTFGSVGAYTNSRETSIGRGTTASTIRISGASASLFTVLGAKPARGRFYAADEDMPPSGSPVAVVSRSYYDGHPDVLGRSLDISNVQYRVIGVAPEGFTGATLDQTDAWIPITSILSSGGSTSYVNDRGSYNISTVARLGDGISNAQAAAQASTVYRTHVDTSFTAPLPAPHVDLAPIIAGRGPGPHSSATVALWLGGVAVIVLLIACANVATLLLTRTIRRNQEIAVRLSLGVSKARLAGQLVIESLLLVTLGALAAVVVARLTHGLVQTTLMRGVAPDVGAPASRTTFLLAAIGLGTALVTALAPAAYATSVDLTSSLKSGNRSGTPARARLRASLSVLQVALSVVLLIGAGLFVRSLQNVRATPLGLDLDRLILARVSFPNDASIPPSPSLPPNASAKARRDAYWREAKRRMLLSSEISNVALTIGVPFRNSMAIGFDVPGRTLPRLQSGGPYANGVDASFFATLGTKVLKGRAFTDADGAGAARVAIVNQTLATAAFGDENPLGRCVRIGADTMPCSTIVGVVENVHRNSIIEDRQAQYYVPLAQMPYDFGGPSMIVRTRGTDAEKLVGQVRRTLQSLTSDSPYPAVQPFGPFLDTELASWRLGAKMFTLFGSLAFLVAIMGVYALLAYSVAQRRHEFGIRTALGAGVDHIVALVVLDGVKIMVLGVVLGLGGAAVAARWIAPLLFGVEPRDTAIYAAIALLAAAAAVAVSLVPARRASGVDPMQALRAD